MNTAKKKMHHAWWVFIGLCFLGFGGFPLIFQVVGIYMGPVSATLGIDVASFALWLTVESVFGLIAMPVAGRIYKRKSSHLFTAGGLALCALGILGFSFCSEMWHLYVCGAVIGIGIPFVYGLPQTVYIGNWFSKKYQGKMLSITMASLVCGPIVWAPVMTMILQNFGWQQTYLINAALFALFTIPWALFAFRRAPEDVGLKPYGQAATTSEEPEKAAEDNDLKHGVTPLAAVKSLPFWLTLIAVCIVCFGMGFQNYEPLMAVEFLTPAGIMTEPDAALFGSTLISIFSVGSLLGTLTFGFLMEKTGLKALFAVFALMFTAGFVLWFLFRNPAMLLVGSFLIGTHSGLATVGFPLLLRRLFGGKNYSVIYSYVNMCSAFVGGFSSAIIGWVYGLVGTLAQTLFLGIGIGVVILIFTYLANTFVGKIKWQAEHGEQAE